MRSSVTRVFTVAFLAVAFVLVGSVQAGFLDGPRPLGPRRALYVDGDYSGANGPSDGSKQRPFSTIQEATELAETLFSVTRIHVDRSTTPYVGPVKIDRSGLALVGDNWNEPGAPLPLIGASAEPTGATLRVKTGNSDVLLEGFEVEIGVSANGTARAIRIAGGCSDIILRNLIVTGAHPGARVLTTGIFVRGSFRVTIEHCLFREIDHPYREDLKHIRAVAIKNSFNVTVQNCEFTRIGETTDEFSFVHLFTGIHLLGGFGNTVRNNLFHDLTFLANDYYGGGGDPYSTAGDITMIHGSDSEYLAVVNNTVANIDATGIQTSVSAKNLRSIYVTDTQHADIRNNLMAYIDWVPGGADGFFCHLHRCPGINPCDPDEPPIVDFSAVTRDWEDDYWPESMEGTGTLSLDTDEALDPVFVDRTNRDYHLAPDSRCVDAGDPGIADPDGSLSDLGCYGGPRGDRPVGIRLGPSPLRLGLR